MARKRQIDPGFWTNEQATATPRDARLLFLGMVSHADDEGRLKGSPAYLKMAILPGDDVSLEQVRQWRDQIVTQKLAVLYTVDGIEYLTLPTWRKHQYISKRQPSRIPAPPQTPKRPNGGDSGSVPAPLPHRSAPVVVEVEVGTEVEETAVGAAPAQTQAQTDGEGPPLPEPLRLFLLQRGTATTATAVERHAARLLEKHGEGAAEAIRRAYAEGWRQLEGGYGSKVRNLVGWLQKLMEKHVRILREESSRAVV